MNEKKMSAHRAYLQCRRWRLIAFARARQHVNFFLLIYFCLIASNPLCQRVRLAYKIIVKYVCERGTSSPYKYTEPNRGKENYLNVRNVFQKYSSNRSYS